MCRSSSGHKHAAWQRAAASRWPAGLGFCRPFTSEKNCLSARQNWAACSGLAACKPAGSHRARCNCITAASWDEVAKVPGMILVAAVKLCCGVVERSAAGRCCCRKVSVTSAEGSESLTVRAFPASLPLWSFCFAQRCGRRGTADFRGKVRCYSSGSTFGLCRSLSPPKLDILALLPCLLFTHSLWLRSVGSSVLDAD